MAMKVPESIVNKTARAMVYFDFHARGHTLTDKYLDNWMATTPDGRATLSNARHIARKTIHTYTTMREAELDDRS